MQSSSSVCCQYIPVGTHFLVPQTLQKNTNTDEIEKENTSLISPKQFKSSFSINSILGQEVEKSNKEEIDVETTLNDEELKLPSEQGTATPNKFAHIWTPQSSPISPPYNMMLLQSFGIPPHHYPLVGAQPQRVSIYRNQMCTCGDANRIHTAHLPIQMRNDGNYPGGIAVMDTNCHHPLSFHECYFTGKYIYI